MSAVTDFVEQAAKDIITILLSLDSLRAVVAALGIVSPEAKYAHWIYGKRADSIVLQGLKELGFHNEQADEIVKQIHAVAEQQQRRDVTKENAAQYLLAILSKYTVFFDKAIQYGGNKTTQSRYYIDTMEMSHNETDLDKIVDIMSCLCAICEKKPDIIVVPKGGNPLFARSVAQFYTAKLVVAKSKSDKSRITTSDGNKYTDFQINYEGSWGVLATESSQISVIMDCNISGGSQLLDIIADLKKISKEPGIKIEPPQQAYVLFRADDGSGNVANENIDQRFNNIGCQLYRFFDLDEKTKQELYELKKNAKQQGRTPDIYYKSDLEKIDEIILDLKKKNAYFYQK